VFPKNGEKQVASKTGTFGRQLIPQHSVELLPSKSRLETTLPLN
jgi:hypothetical protein